MIIIGGILVLFIYMTRLASNEIFSPSNKIHPEVGQAKALSAPRYCNDLLFSTSKMVFRCSPSFCLPQPAYATCVMSTSFPWSFNVPCPIESTISPECKYFLCSDFSFLISNILLWARYLLSSVTCHPTRITPRILALVNNFFSSFNCCVHN